jgi:hypothetical protein
MKLSHILIPALLLAGPASADPVSPQPANPANSTTRSGPTVEHVGAGDPVRPPIQQGPTVEQVQEQASGIISALRAQRDDANDRLAQAVAANAKLTRDLDAAKKAAEPKKDDAK